jgi:hypothetical protein
MEKERKKEDQRQYDEGLNNQVLSTTSLGAC